MLSAAQEINDSRHDPGLCGHFEFYDILVDIFQKLLDLFAQGLFFGDDGQFLFEIIGGYPQQQFGTGSDGFVPEIFRHGHKNELQVVQCDDIPLTVVQIGGVAGFPGLFMKNRLDLFTAFDDRIKCAEGMGYVGFHHGKAPKYDMKKV
jgi:hypothetical protein